MTAVAPSCPTHCATDCWENGPYDAAKRPVLHCHTACFTRQNGLCRLFKKTRTRHRKPPLLLSRDKVAAHGLRAGLLTRAESQLPSTACPIPGMGFCHCTADCLGHWQGRGVAWAHAAWGLSSCSKLIAIKLCAISEMHAKVRRESVAGYATDETLVCGPKEHTRWSQRYSGHLQGLLYRLILNSYLLIRHNDCILQAFMPVALVCRRLCSLRREKARTGGMAMESMRMGKQQGQCRKRHWRIEARWQRNGACKRMHAQTCFATAHRPQGSQAGPSGCHPSHATAGRALTGGPDPMCKAGNEKGDDGIRCRHPQMSYSFKIILLRL
mgnify:FL=1